jgi:hypothetical protein
MRTCLNALGVGCSDGHGDDICVSVTEFADQTGYAAMWYVGGGGCSVAPFRNFHQNGISSGGICAVNRQTRISCCPRSAMLSVSLASGRKIRWNQVVAVQARTC